MRRKINYVKEIIERGKHRAREDFEAKREPRFFLTALMFVRLQKIKLVEKHFLN